MNSNESADDALQDDALQQLEHRLSNLNWDDDVDTSFDLDALLRKLKQVDANGVQDVTPPGRADDPPTEFGCLAEYELIESIGSGGASRVYRARHQLLHRDVALKVLRSDRDAAGGDEDDSEPTRRKFDDANLKRFRREMQVLAKLHSPHIVTATDARIVDGQPILAMELVDGVTLGQHVCDHRPMAVSTACDWIRQTATGLAAAHGAGVIHRDIKPANLMIDVGGVIKILDFGLASLRMGDAAGEHDSLTSPSTVMGTVDTISPEQIDDARTADARSDVYSLGCVFHFLLTGHPPFSTQEYPSDVARLMAHMSVPPKPPSHTRGDVPAAIDAIVTKSLAKNPNDRFASMKSLEDALAQAISQGPRLEGPISQAPTSPGPTSQGPIA